jgi:AAA+ superfamily predicted ATPase
MKKFLFLSIASLSLHPLTLSSIQTPSSSYTPSQKNSPEDISATERVQEFLQHYIDRCLEAADQTSGVLQEAIQLASEGTLTIPADTVELWRTLNEELGKEMNALNNQYLMEMKDIGAHIANIALMCDMVAQACAGHFAVVPQSPRFNFPSSVEELHQIGYLVEIIEKATAATLIYADALGTRWFNRGYQSLFGMYKKLKNFPLTDIILSRKLWHMSAAAVCTYCQIDNGSVTPDQQKPGIVQHPGVLTAVDVMQKIEVQQSGNFPDKSWTLDRFLIKRGEPYFTANVISAFAFNFALISRIDTSMGLSDTGSKIWGGFHSLLLGKSIFKDRSFRVSDRTLDDACFDACRAKLGPLYNIIEKIKNKHNLVQASRNVLIIGSSGNGKTYLAKAFHETLRRTFEPMGKKVAFVEWTLLDSMFSTNQGSSWKDCLEYFKRYEAVVVYIDELHLFGLNQASDKGLLEQFLTGLTSLDQDRDKNNNVFVIASTNNPHSLDPALVKNKSRFATIIHLPSPNYEQRIMMLQAECKRAGVPLTQLPLERLAHITEGVTQSELNKTFATALGFAKQTRKPLQTSHFYLALNQIVRRVDPVQLTLPAATIATISHYYAAQATYHLLGNTHNKVDSVTIYPLLPNVLADDTAPAASASTSKPNYGARSFGKLFTWRPGIEVPLTDIASIKEECMSLLAGHVYARMNQLKALPQTATDRAQAYAIAHLWVRGGLPEDCFSKAAANAKRDEAHLFLEECERELEAFFSAEDSREAVSTIATKLVETPFITYDELLPLLGMKE